MKKEIDLVRTSFENYRKETEEWNSSELKICGIGSRLNRL